MKILYLKLGKAVGYLVESIFLLVRFMAIV